MGNELNPACRVLVVANKAFTNLSPPFKSDIVLLNSSPKKNQNSIVEIITRLRISQ